MDGRLVGLFDWIIVGVGFSTAEEEKSRRPSALIRQGICESDLTSRRAMGYYRSIIGLMAVRVRDSAGCGVSIHTLCYTVGHASYVAAENSGRLSLHSDQAMKTGEFDKERGETGG